ncbi:hypothetical protein ACXY7D_18060, partial [Sphingomonas melonis]
MSARRHHGAIGDPDPPHRPPPPREQPASSVKLRTSVHPQVRAGGDLVFSSQSDNAYALYRLPAVTCAG